MKQSGLFVVVLLLFLFIPRPVRAADAPPPLDVVTLKDGSIIYGDVVGMETGLLEIKSPWAGEVIKVKWGEVSKLKISRP
ncbi:hypothetical protein N4G37_13900, partial [Enterococcus faecalis]|uniref:hypothetical protein n=1 Tax=Enterococcus faecalis TaxID=1351 RepID=UPI0021B0FBC3